MEYLCANSRRFSVCTLHLLVGTIHQSNARAEPMWITCGRRSSHLFLVRKKNSFLLPGYGNVTMAADESRLSTDFGASVSFVCACGCVCALVRRVDLLDNLRAHSQSHSVWLKSPSWLKFSITLKLKWGHLKPCSAISYHVILLNKKKKEQEWVSYLPDVAADGWMNWLILCGGINQLPAAWKLLKHTFLVFFALLFQFVSFSFVCFLRSN